MRSRNMIHLCAISMILAGCGTRPIQPSDKHLQQPTSPLSSTTGIPQTIKRSVVLPPPKPAAKAETYSVVVTNVPAQEILFALARDAKINLDIHPGIQGTVTLNALNQTLPQILTRIAKQVDMRYELDGPNLAVMPDKPFLRTYKIDFINMSRTVESKNLTSTQITGTAGNSAASTSVTSNTKNDLMESLIQNVKDIILDEDKLHYQEQVDLQTQQNIRARGTGAASGSISLASPTQNTGIEINQATKGGQVNSGSRTGSSVSGSGNQDVQGQGEAVAKKGVYERAVSVFANKETGVLIVRATSRQHEKILEFIDMVMATAKRQVLIEATIVEVHLSDNYKQGINWSLLQRGGTGFQLRQAATAGLPSANAANMFVLDYLNPTSRLGNLTASISLLESFGNVKVLSSPKLSVMNNQTATLRVADNKVYFTVASTPATFDRGVMTSPATYTTTPNSVSVGFVMNVTPQISNSDTVTINVRPTITRIVSYVNDPNPDLANAGVINRVPEIQTREMESIIKIV